MLRRLLNTLGAQRTEGLFNYSAVVVDNDRQELGREPVLSVQAKSKYAIDYYIEPERSISLARNRSVRSANGNLIAFIDDDEFPDDNWLVNHYKTLLASGADGVLGPVKPHFKGKAPKWLVKSGLLERKRFKTSELIKDYRYTRTGNVLLWKELFEEKAGLFDPKYGTSGGGDAVFFKRMMEQGRTFAWCDEAVVYETVPIERQKKMYHVRRAFTRGMTSAWEAPFLSTGTVRSTVAIFIYTLFLPLAVVIGQHLFMKYLVKDCDHVSKLLAYIGIRFVKERP